LAIDWQELGGPAVVPPTRSGYGTSIVRELIPFELGGHADLVFAADGVRCHLEIAAEWVLDDAEQRVDRPPLKRYWEMPETVSFSALAIGDTKSIASLPAEPETY
jgi:hypothetical protein